MMTHADILALEGLEACPHHETRPCPFCGGEAYLVRRLVPGREEWKDDPDGEAWRYWAVCRCCAAEGPWRKSGALGAAQRWNRRKRSASAKMEDYGNWLKAEVTVRELRAENARLAALLKASEWALGSDVGISSMTIWRVMTGLEAKRYHDACVPLDTGDFGRCHRMLLQFPEWRARLPEVAARHPEWAPLVREWDRLTRLFEQDTDACYALLRQLRAEGRKHA